MNSKLIAQTEITKYNKSRISEIILSLIDATKKFKVNWTSENEIYSADLDTYEVEINAKEFNFIQVRLLLHYPIEAVIAQEIFMKPPITFSFFSEEEKEKHYLEKNQIESILELIGVIQSQKAYFDQHCDAIIELLEDDDE